jgi:uncharacterized protein YehS (DUF1456 family)
VTHNDILRSVRYLLDVGDARLAEIIRMGGGVVTPDQVVAFLKKEDEPGYVECGHPTMAAFLNGLIIYKRGKDESRPPLPVEIPVTNNTILKRLRVAFELKDSDIIALIERCGLRVSKAELGAFFRRPDHRNYRDCGDQFLRNLLRGMGTPVAAPPTTGMPPGQRD